MDARSIFELIEFGRYSEASQRLSSAQTLDPQDVIGLKLLIAVETVATDLVDHEFQRASQDGFDRAALFQGIALGKWHSVSGRWEAACASLRPICKFLEQTGDVKLLARVQARLTKQLLRSGGIDAAVPELARLRRYALSAGDRRALADLHCIAAEIRMKQGHYAEALRQLGQARSVYVEPADVLTRAQVSRLTANVYLLASSPTESLVAVREAVQLWEEYGNRYGLTSALSTAAENHLLLGQYGEAEAILERLTSLNTSAMILIHVLDSRVQVAIACSELTTAMEFCQQIDGLHADAPNPIAWLWHVPTRCKLMLHQGQAEQALRFIRAHMDLILKTSDRRLIARCRLVEIEALHRSGGRADAVRHLVRLSRTGNGATLEDLTEIYRLQGVCSERFQEMHLQRAEAIRRLGLSGRTAHRLPGGKPERLSGMEVLNAVRALFDFSGHAGLMASEVAALLAGLGCVEDVKISPQRDLGSQGPKLNSIEGPELWMHIGLAAQAGRDYVVSARVKQGPDAELAAAAVQSLVESAIAIGQSRHLEAVEPNVLDHETIEEVNGLIVATSNMVELINITRRVATSNVTVLFTGETGTGKELLARLLHDASPRKDKPFIPFNCTSVARDMLDSQLFGYKRGAFTGAHEAFPGVIRAAQGGTLFLDEIGEMPLDLQPKLLRFLESGEVHPLGEPRPLPVDVRVVAATNANLEELVSEGRFREDLFYRLNVVRLQVPPLRERREEIPLLAQHYIDRWSRESHKTGIRLAEETMEYLVLYKWPGNVRQLTNEIRRMVALAESSAVLMPEHLSHEIASSRRTIPASQRDLAPTEFVVRMDQPMSAATEHLERSMIKYALRLTNNRLEDAAHLLGLSRKGLYLKRTRLKLDDEDVAEPVPAPVTRSLSRMAHGR